jgi:hypothetical protein
LQEIMEGKPLDKATWSCLNGVALPLSGAVAAGNWRGVQLNLGRYRSSIQSNLFRSRWSVRGKI